MGLFYKLKDPVFLKDDSEADRHLAALQELRKKATGDLAGELDEEISRVNADDFIRTVTYGRHAQKIRQQVIINI